MNPLNRRKVCLLATDRPTCNLGYENRVQKHIEKCGYWIAWWSFPIKDKAGSYLVNKPFYIYISEGKGVFTYRYTVIDYISSKGNKGRLCPWQDLLEDHMKNKIKDWAACKTWFKSTEFKRVSLKTLKDFVPIKGLSKENSLICRSTFGYAFRK